MTSTGFYLESRKIISDHRCIKTLSTGVAMGFFYFLMMLFGYLSGEPLPVLDLYWAVTKLILAYSLFCIYKSTGKGKHAGGGIIIAASAFLTAWGFFTGGNPIAVLMDALSIAVISLVLYDVSKVVPEANLEKPAGAIFLGLMFSLVSQTTIAALGLLLVVIGMVYSANRLDFVYSLSKRLSGGT
ncbi:hypothetical protein [Thermococcus sp. GR6]|uniref:hypothetical protein n=1 Tax=Thermococcus sp. GR6 TaxID=1638256 RepID=UPI001430C8DA|nr:hypothetical protein [Thermococcus sp. GR6]NJE41965.1 hypothetical protein [Thermococcus sp. GR6]